MSVLVVVSLDPLAARAEEQPTPPAPCPAAQAMPAELPDVARDRVAVPGDILKGVGAGEVLEGRTVLQIWWLVDNQPRGQQLETYEVRKQDAGSSIAQLAVFAQPAQCASWGVLFGISASVTAKVSTSVTTSVSGKTQGEGAVVRVKVKTPGADSPSGTVTISWGKKDGKSRRVHLAPTDHGVVRMTLPLLSRGSTVSVKATFEDQTGKALDGTAKTVRFMSKG
ncbi:MAG: hypothetical protein LBK59_06195 [Bifidobacteriaceae bacterium]|nr:hypothetical protein [Bifidobacteriaceae bacterium]